MNPFEVLNIEPTRDKMAIRRAYVRETKIHHPDHGGDPEHFYSIQRAYEILVGGQKPAALVIEDEVRLELADLMYGCVATAIIDVGRSNKVIEFDVPPYTYPGTTIEFFDKGSTTERIRVKLLENHKEEYTRLDSSIVVQRQINTTEAKNGISLEIENFDGEKHTVTVSPETTANKLIFHVNGAGFFSKHSKVRGDLTVIVEVKKEGN